MLKRIKNWIIDKWKRFKKWFIGLFVIATVLAAAGTTIERTIEIDEPRLSEPSGLVLHLDQSDPRSYGDAGNWYDLSGHGNHGTQGTAANQPSITGSENLAGYTRKFDGVNDYVDCGDAPELRLTKNFTIIAWIKTTQSGDYKSLVTKYNPNSPWTGYGVAILNGNIGFWSNQYWSIEGGNWVEGSAVNDGTWKQVVIIQKDSVVDFYIDGVFDVQRDSYEVSDSTGFNLHIGGVTNEFTFQGSIDSVRIYNRALSAAEIQRLYMATAPKHGGF